LKYLNENVKQTKCDYSKLFTSGRLIYVAHRHIGWHSLHLFSATHSRRNKKRCNSFTWPIKYPTPFLCHSKLFSSGTLLCLQTKNKQARA